MGYLYHDLMPVKTLLSALLIAGALAAVSVDAADTGTGAVPKRSPPVGVGEVAPDFTLEDQNGRPHPLSAQRGKRPAVLIFYRGHW